MGFWFNLQNVFSVMWEILLIALCGAFFFRRKLVQEQFIRSLSILTINLFLPCLIFTHLIEKFNFTSVEGWWIYPLLGIIVSGVGYVLAKCLLVFNKSLKAKNEFISLITFQNCGYLPLVLVSEIFPTPVANRLFIYIFLFIQGFNLVFWTYGVRLLGGHNFPAKKFRNIFNMPFLALLLSLLIVAAKLQFYIPNAIKKAAGLFGECTLPMAIFTLGAVLTVNAKELKNSKFFFIATLAGKLILMPAIAFVIIYYFRLPVDLALVILIEASMPSAINLGVVSFYQEAKYEIVSQGVLFTHLFSLVTIPAFLSLFYLLR